MGLPYRTPPTDLLTGIVTVNLLPSPGVLSAATRPPCSSTRLRTMANPNPLPPVPRERALSAR